MNEQRTVASRVKGLSLVIEIEVLLRRWALTGTPFQADDTVLCAQHPKHRVEDEI
ncbi:unnamed protein product [Xyrichtys novacula]|uniref:Unnamed protein product n=1 Tax=Xyrichtys novacula TaxID=13765 RepID=A0AAV1HKR3_XYRNO|nr:unnamed protein product [Xyrichtys novacula]